MLKKLSLAAALCLSLLVNVPARQQQPPPQAPFTESSEEKKKQEALKELEKKALVMLEEVTGEASALRVPENRARILAAVADLTWTRDEKHARSLFREAVNSVNEAAARPVSGSRPEKRYSGYWSVYRVRGEVLEAVARRDSQLALELLRAPMQPLSAVPSDPANVHQMNWDLLLEQRLIGLVAANDPKRALKMAEESLAKGVSNETLGLLQRLRAKDREAGEKFAAGLVRKLRTLNVANQPDLLSIGQNLLQMTQGSPGTVTLRRGATGASGAEDVPKGPLRLGDQDVRDLVNWLVTAAIPTMGEESHLSLLESILADVEKHVPERAQALKQRIAQWTERLSPEARAWREAAPLFQSDSGEAVLEGAAKLPEGMRNAAYTRAAWLYAGRGDIDRARQIVREKIGNEHERAQVIEALDRAELRFMLTKGKLEDARRMVSRTADKENKAAMLAGLAALAAVRGEKKLAAEMLDEARLLVGERPKSLQQLGAYLMLARAYALVEPARSFDIIEAVIDKANDLIAAADVLDGFLGGPEIFRDGELLLTTQVASFEQIFQLFGREMAALARADFDRARSAAARFQRPEVRAMSRLLVAQGLLSDRKPPELTPEMILNGGMLTGGMMMGAQHHVY